MNTTLANQSSASAFPSLPSLPISTESTSKLQTIKLPMAALIRRVMQQSDDLVLVIDYTGKDGSITRRVVSPIRFVAEDRFLALCLSREEPRQFYLNQCSNVRVDLANHYVMPVELVQL